MTSVSVIGLGAMGARLAMVLLHAGFRVTVWNRSVGKATQVVEAGAVQARSAAEAIRASPVTITCIRSHSDTRALLGEDPSALQGKTVIELSTGDSAQAAALTEWLTVCGAECLIGMIAVFPKDIGMPDSAILVAGQEETWRAQESLLKSLAGASLRIGGDPGALAAIYASLVLPRQGFMFGMIYGALICRKAGISMEDYVKVLPQTMRIVEDYYTLFTQTVPGGNFDDPPASLGVYHAAFEDVLKTCGELGAADEFPRCLYALLQRGMEAGLGEKQITALVGLLSDERG